MNSVLTILKMWFRFLQVLGAVVLLEISCWVQLLKNDTIYTSVIASLPMSRKCYHYAVDFEWDQIGSESIRGWHELILIIATRVNVVILVQLENDFDVAPSHLTSIPDVFATLAKQNTGKEVLRYIGLDKGAKMFNKARVHDAVMFDTLCQQSSHGWWSISVLSTKLLSTFISSSFHLPALRTPQLVYGTWQSLYKMPFGCILAKQVFVLPWLQTTNHFESVLRLMYPALKFQRRTWALIWPNHHLPQRQWAGEQDGKRPN